jgi:DMSO/TMAO reductase YedYZ molybdopterin-dependent catalytic subunit
MTDSPLSLRRRQLLAGSAGAIAGTGLVGLAGEAAAQATTPAAPRTALPAYLAWKDANAVIVHNPNELETKRSAFGTSGITPTDHLYVRNNVNPPDPSILADRGAWQVAIEGVRDPRTLTVNELKTIGIETTATVLQCSGNGRAFFPHKPSGAKWTVGASGCVVWSGVPVRYVVEALGGPAANVRYLTGTGGETFPAGIDPLTVMVERSLPIEAMNDALLAWEMNGEPLPLVHGGPLRLIVPGYQGVNNVKYVKRVALTPVESSASIQKSRYRLNAIGTQATQADPSVLGMTVKSFVTSPSGGEPVRAGVVYVTGVAFGGGSPIKRVEVSSDGGRTWIDAPFFGPDLGRFAWRQFAVPLRMTAGNYVLTSRATDAAGHVQPEARSENAAGYANTSWADHAVRVAVG